MRKRQTASIPWLDSLDAALDELPAPELLTGEENLRIVAALDRISERVKRRELELWVKIALDEYRGPIPIRQPKKAS